MISDPRFDVEGSSPVEKADIPPFGPFILSNKFEKLSWSVRCEKSNSRLADDSGEGDLLNLGASRSVYPTSCPPKNQITSSLDDPREEAIDWEIQLTVMIVIVDDGR